MKINKPTLSCGLLLGFLAAAQANPPSFPAAKPLVFNLPKTERYTMPNGITVYLLADKTLPLVRATILLRSGGLYEPQGKIGLASLTAESMRAGGSAKYRADDVNEQLESIGASVNFYAGLEASGGSLFCLAQDTDKVFDIAADLLQNPAFDEAKVKVAKDAVLEGIRRRNDDPQSMAMREAWRVFYGKDNPYGRRTEASEVAALSTDDMRAFHKRYYKPGALNIAVSGFFDTETMKKLLLDKFGGWKSAPPELAAVPAPQPSAARAVYFIDKASAVNAPIFVLMPGMKRHDADTFPMAVANSILGAGGMGSRLFVEVRSKRGLAYGVGSFVAQNDLAGSIGAYCGTKNVSVNEAIDEILRQLKLMKETPVTSEELDRAKDGLVDSYVFNFTTPAQVLGARMSNDYFGFPADYLETYTAKISAVTAKDVQAVSARWYAPDTAMIFVVGDTKKFTKPLAAFGPVNEIPAD